jgi:hypothetical protein
MDDTIPCGISRALNPDALKLNLSVTDESVRHTAPSSSATIVGEGVPGRNAWLQLRARPADVVVYVSVAELIRLRVWHRPDHAAKEQFGVANAIHSQ